MCKNEWMLMIYVIIYFDYKWSRDFGTSCNLGCVLARDGPPTNPRLFVNAVEPLSLYSAVDITAVSVANYSAHPAPTYTSTALTWDSDRSTCGIASSASNKSIESNEIWLDWRIWCSSKADCSGSKTMKKEVDQVLIKIESTWHLRLCLDH